MSEEKALKQEIYNLLSDRIDEHGTLADKITAAVDVLFDLFVVRVRPALEAESAQPRLVAPEEQFTLIADNEDEDEQLDRFENHYRCDDCDGQWTDYWSCGCDDECPKCGRDFSPYESIDTYEEESQCLK